MLRLTFAAAASLCVCLPAFAMPRPITDAEKAACEAVADHLGRGAVAIAERSHLNVEEIETRTGPNAEARWELRTAAEEFAQHGAVFHVIFPTGVDDVITFDMKQEAGAWRVAAIRCLADVATGASRSANDRLKPVLTLCVAMVIVVARKRRRWPVLAAIVGAAILIPGLTLLWPRHHAVPNVVDGTPSDDTAFSSLLPMRRAMAAGDPLPQIGQFTGPVRDAALLWKVQREIGRVSPVESERQLNALTTAAPLAPLLRARVAALEGRDAQALEQYDAFRKAAPAHDALWWEEEMASPRESETEPLRRAIQLQTRDADIYYLLAIDHFVHDKQSQAVAVFHEALSLKPVSRATVVSSGILSLLPHDMSSTALVDTNAPDEPKAADASLSQSAMRVPAGTRSTAAGSFVRLRINGGQLDIPNGAAIAPAGTEVITGEQMDREEADDAVQRATRLSDALVASGAVQRTIENAVDALETHNRWGDIIRLTDSITPQSENVSADLLIARVRALVRAKQFAEARRLATSAAADRVIERRPRAFIVATLAELLAETGAYEQALEMYRRAKDIKGAPDMTMRSTQVALRRTLELSTETAHTAHFEIHSMPEVPPQIPKKIGEQLESDLQMLMARFKLTHFKTVRVNVLRWDDFRWSVTGSDYVVGFYDGDLTIPWGTLFFGLSSESVTTHELTHAVIAQASHDNAPRWFQEGIAQRMERVEKQDNIFDPAKKKPVVAMALLDAMLQGSADVTDITSAYTESQTVMRYLEDRYGAQSINKMVTAYRNGGSNEDAIRAATGKSVADTDRDFRNWGTTHYRPFEGNATAR